MNSFDFEKLGYITKSPLCHSTRTVLENNFYECFGVSLRHKYSNGYFNYLLEHEIVEKDFFWKIDSLFGDKREDSWTISIQFLRKENCKAYEKLRSFLYHFTEESVRKALASSPHLAELLINAYSPVNFHNKEIGNSVTCIGLSFHIYHFNIGKYYSESTEKDEANILCEYANIIRKELNSFSLDTSKLKNKPKEEPFLPNWLSNTIKVGGRIGLKVLCAQLGTNIGGDLFGNFDGGDIPDGTEFSNADGFDFSDGTDFSNADGFDFSDGTDFSDKSELDFSNGDFVANNVSFCGKATPNFDTGQDVHIVCESGADKGYFDVYLQDGKKYVKFGNGSSNNWSNWVLIQGKQSFSWNGNRYIIK